jgi:hypothetical protein
MPSFLTADTISHGFRPQLLVSKWNRTDFFFLYTCKSQITFTDLGQILRLGIHRRYLPKWKGGEQELNILHYPCKAFLQQNIQIYRINNKQGYKLSLVGMQLSENIRRISTLKFLLYFQVVAFLPTKACYYTTYTGKPFKINNKQFIYRITSMSTLNVSTI